LGEQLGIDVTADVRILVLLWKMDCKEKPGSITLTEWTNGCELLGVDSFDGMVSQLPSLELGFLENAAFKDFYKFCFKFNLTGTHRTLPKELVVELLQLVLKDRDPYDRVGPFISFLQQTDSSYSCITMDQWCSFFDFSIEMGEDVSTYDESTSAWPVLIDEFVDYLAKHQSS
jgi:Cullin binding